MVRVPFCPKKLSHVDSVESYYWNQSELSPLAVNTAKKGSVVAEKLEEQFCKIVGLSGGTLGT